MTAFQPSSLGDLALLNRSSVRGGRRTSRRGGTSSPQPPPFQWLDVTSIPDVTGWEPYTSTSWTAQLPPGSGIEGGVPFTDPQQVSVLLGYYLTYPTSRMGAGSPSDPGDGTAPSGEQVQYLIMNRLNHIRKWMEWVLSQGGTPSVTFTTHRGTGDVLVSSFVPADQGLALLNPAAGNDAKATRRKKRKARAKALAKKQGITVKEALAQMKAKAKSKKRKGGREGALATQEVQEIEELEYEEDLEEVPEEGSEEGSGSMGPLLLVGGIAAAATAGWFFFRKR